MRSLNKINSDFIAVGISFIIISTFSVLLYADFTSKIDVGDAKKIGVISFKRKVAQRKYSSQVVWEDLDQNVPVYNNDSIRTSDFSEAVIKLEDGTSINLDENSMILLAMLGDGININFSHGSISAKSGGKSKKEGEGSVSRIKIQSKGTSVSLGKGDIKLSRSANKELNLTVTKGTAEVKTGNEKKIIEKDQKVIISKDLKTKIFKLKLKLQEPSPGHFFITSQPAMPVKFSWEPVERGNRIFLEVSRNKNFTRPVVRKAVKGTSFAQNLAGGNYYWRLKVINNRSKKVESSEIRKLNIVKDQVVRLVYPQMGAAINYSVKPPNINFNWQQNKLASGYILEISRNPDFKSTKRSVRTSLTRLVIDKLREGKYFWRVRTKTSIDVAAYNGTSQVYSFNIVKKTQINPPRLISPQNGKNVSVHMFGEKGFLFSWRADSQIKSYDVFIARDSNFRKLEMRIKNNGNYFRMVKKLRPGKYYWKVVTSSKNLSKQLSSQTNSLSIVDIRKINLISPGNNVKFDIKEGDKYSSIKFSWTRSDIAGNYMFELSKEKNFAAVINRKITNRNYYNIIKLKPGVYYWRVKLLDKDKSKITESQSYMVNVHQFVKKDEIAKSDIGEKSEITIIPSVTGSLIYVNSKVMGRNKVTFNPVPGKSLKIEVKKEGYKPYADTIKLKPGEKREIEAVLTLLDAGKESATLKVTSSVKGSSIFIDNVFSGKDNAARKADPGKLINIMVKHKGFKVYREKVKLRPGETKVINARLIAVKEAKDEDVVKQPKYKWKKRIQWSTNFASSIMSDPVFYKSMIFVTTRKGTIARLNKNGNRVWTTNLGNVVKSTPGVSDKAVYVVNVRGWLFSLNIKNGKINWKKNIQGTLLFRSGPVAVKDKVFVATSQGMIYMFNEKGEKKWETDLEAGVFSSITLHGNTLYIGTDQSRVHAVNARNGRIRWTFRTDSRILSSSPKIYKGTLYIGSYKGTLYAINAMMGYLKWKFKTKKSILSTPVCMGSSVYFGSEDGIFYALNINSGKKEWEYNTKMKIRTGPGASGNEVFVLSGSTIYSLEKKSGKLMWREGFGNNINTSVTVAGNRIYFGLANGQVVSLKF